MSLRLLGNERTVIADADRLRPALGDLRDERAHPLAKKHERADARKFLAAHAAEVDRVPDHAVAQEVS